MKYCHYERYRLQRNSICNGFSLRTCIYEGLAMFFRNSGDRYIYCDVGYVQSSAENFAEIGTYVSSKDPLTLDNCRGCTRPARKDVG